MSPDEELGVGGRERDAWPEDIVPCSITARFAFLRQGLSTEPGAGLVACQCHWSSCPHPPQSWGYRCFCGHAQLFMSVLGSYACPAPSPQPPASSSVVNPGHMIRDTWLSGGFAPDCGSWRRMSESGKGGSSCKLSLRYVWRQGFL